MMSAAIGKLLVSFSCDETFSGAVPPTETPFVSIEKEAGRGPQGLFGHAGLGLMFEIGYSHR